MKIDIFDETLAIQYESEGFLRYLGQTYNFYGKLLANGENATIKKSLGYNIDDFIISCSYLGDECDLNEFQWFWHNTYGNCYKFNSGFNSNGSKIELKSVPGHGIYNSLSMELFSGISDKLELVSSDLFGLGTVITYW